jgi:type III secretion protein J
MIPQHPPRLTQRRMMQRLATCAAAGLLMLLTGCRDQTIYSGLAQREANEMMALLRRSGIETKLALDARTSTVTIAVPQADAGSAVEALSRAGYPRVKTPTMTELLPKDTWMLSPSEERAKLAYAQSQEMMGTLRQVSGITDVRVHFAPADRNALGQSTTQPSASVLVRYDADIIGPDYADRIKSLVANSIAGLSYDRVTVMMVASEQFSAVALKGDALRATNTEATSTTRSIVFPDWLTGAMGRLMAALAIAGVLGLALVRRLKRG